MSIEDDEIVRRGSQVACIDDMSSDCDSGNGSDDYDLLELGKAGEEFCQVGDQTCSIPYELYECSDLGEILSLDVWNEYLTEEERFRLTKYLPDMDQEMFLRTLKQLFTGASFYFDSPLPRLFNMLRGGLCEPRVTLYRQGLISFQKRQHCHLVREYHNTMVVNFHQIKDAWRSCKGYSLEEKLQIFNIMKSQKRVTNGPIDELMSDAFERNEERRAPNGKKNRSVCFQRRVMRLKKEQPGILYQEGTMEFAESKTFSAKEVRLRNDMFMGYPASLKDPHAYMDNRNADRLSGIKKIEYGRSYSGNSLMKGSRHELDNGFEFWENQAHREALSAGTSLRKGNQNTECKNLEVGRPLSDYTFVDGLYSPENGVKLSAGNFRSNSMYNRGHTRRNVKYEEIESDLSEPDDDDDDDEVGNPVMRSKLACRDKALNGSFIKPRLNSMMVNKSQRGLKIGAQPLDELSRFRKKSGHIRNSIPNISEDSFISGSGRFGAAAEMGKADLDKVPKLQKKPLTPITPTVHSGFSFSVIHFLSAVRMAMVTLLPEDSLVIGGANRIDIQEDLESSRTDPSVQSRVPSITLQEIVNRVRSNPGDPCVLEAQEPLQDLVRGVLKIFSSKAAPLGAKCWKLLVSYEKSTKTWSWTGPVSHSSSDNEVGEEVTSPEAWLLPRNTLVKLVDSFANWLKSSQEILRLIGSLPNPPLSQFHMDDKERFRDLRAQKSLITIGHSTEEIREYFRKEEFLRYLMPDRAFSYTAIDGQKSMVAPLRKCAGKSTSKARDHFLLKPDRPPHVTILCLVRDAAARLPGTIGTRADVSTLIRDSQYAVEEISDAQVNQVVSGALDRLHYERDPCVQYDGERKLWVYLHRGREEEDFEDDGTSSTKRWKRPKKEAPEPHNQEMTTLAYCEGGEQNGFDLSSDLKAGSSNGDECKKMEPSDYDSNHWMEGNVENHKTDDHYDEMFVREPLDGYLRTKLL